MSSSVSTSRGYEFRNMAKLKFSELNLSSQCSHATINKLSIKFHN